MPEPNGLMARRRRELGGPGRMQGRAALARVCAFCQARAREGYPCEQLMLLTEDKNEFDMLCWRVPVSLSLCAAGEHEAGCLQGQGKSGWLVDYAEEGWAHTCIDGLGRMGLLACFKAPKRMRFWGMRRRHGLSSFSCAIQPPYRHDCLRLLTCAPAFLHAQLRQAGEDMRDREYEEYGHVNSAPMEEEQEQEEREEREEARGREDEGGSRRGSGGYGEEAVADEDMQDDD